MKKIIKVLLSVVIVIAGFWLIVNIIPCKKVIDENPFMAKETTLISAHRGGAIMNPENTKMAFDEVIFDIGDCGGRHIYRLSTKGACDVVQCKKWTRC